MAEMRGRVPHSVLFHMASNQPLRFYAGGFYHIRQIHINMIALLKTITNKMEELAGKAIKTDPFRVQEGGDHYKDMRIQPAEFIHTNNVPPLS